MDRKLRFASFLYAQLENSEGVWCEQSVQGRRKQLGSGAATANQNTAEGLGALLALQRIQGRALVGVQEAQPPKAPRISSFRNPKMVMLFEYLGSWCENH